MEGKPKLMTDTLIDEILAKLVLPGEDPTRGRPVHTIGVGATGAFTASEVARRWCRAKHFDGKRHPVTVRFSNGLGSAEQHDDWSDVRGMATRFHLPPDGEALTAITSEKRLSIDHATDLIAMTLPEFFTPTPETFLAFLKKAEPVPPRRESWWRKIADQIQLMDPLPDPPPDRKYSPDEGAIAWADSHAGSQLAVMHAAAIGRPESYARAAYHAVHSFGVVGDEDPSRPEDAARPQDGLRRWVRFAWLPVAGVLNYRPQDKPGANYLKQELEDRLKRDPVRFSLMMTVGEPGDDVNDPTRPWPPHRMRVVMGELTLDGLFDDALTEKLSFNPWLLADGIEASDDQVLLARREAYGRSSARRGGACPFTGR